MSVDAESLPYRPCVGTVVFHPNGKVWIGRRVGAKELKDATQLWQWPQGGLDDGEDPLEGALRELYEETGMESVLVLREHPEWLTYDLPEHLLGVALKGKYRGQKQKWYAVAFQGMSDEIRIHEPPDGHTPEFDAWRWEKLDAVPQLVVPFKRHVYDQVASAFRDLAPQQ